MPLQIKVVMALGFMLTDAKLILSILFINAVKWMCGYHLACSSSVMICLVKRAHLFSRCMLWHCQAVIMATQDCWSSATAMFWSNRLRLLHQWLLFHLSIFTQVFNVDVRLNGPIKLDSTAAAIWQVIWEKLCIVLSCWNLCATDLILGEISANHHDICF